MAAALIFAFFAALGLGVFFVAMRGGPRATIVRRDPSTESRRLVTISVVSVVAIFGIGLPTYIVLHNEDNASAGGPGGVELSADLKEGREAFTDNCAQCHQLEDAGAVGRVGPDLDVLRPVADLTVDAIAEGRARGQGQMPAELLDGEEARNVADYVQRVAGR